MEQDTDNKKTIITYSLKASERQNNDSSIYSMLNVGVANTSKTEYKLSKYHSLNRQKFSAQDFEHAVVSGKLEYLKKCDELHICPCTKLLNMLDNNVECIKLNHYGIGAKGIYAFSQIVSINRNLTEIQLNDNSINSIVGICSLFKALQNNESLISTIDISQNNIGAISSKLECGTDLCKLLKTNSNIRILNISKCNLKNMDIMNICDGLSHNTTLNKMYLSKNSFNDTACQYISDALKENVTLRILDLSWNCISDIGIEQIIDALKDNTGLKNLNASFCSISLSSKQTLNKISNFLQEHEYIETLDLSNNNIRLIEDSSIEILSKGIRQTSLKDLHIEFNPFSANATFLIKQALNDSNLTTHKFKGNYVAERNIFFTKQMKEYDDEYQEVIQNNDLIAKNMQKDEKA